MSAQKQALVDLCEKFGARGGILLIVGPDGTIYVTAGAGDDETTTVLAAIKAKLGPLAMEGTCLLQGMMPCGGCQASGKIPGTAVICLGCQGKRYVKRPGTKEIVIAS